MKHTIKAGEHRSMFVRAAAVVIAICLAAALALPAFAADPSGRTDEPYTYTIRIFPGNKGTVDNGTDPIVITGVKAGYEWTQNDYEKYTARAQVPENSKYKVTGIRESGKDNNTRNRAFTVDRDYDLVVCYGIPGSEIKYTVHYLEYGNNTVLHEPDEYYGNIGEKPVVSYRHIENYTPQYLNLTGTLESGSANEWTFYYVPNEAQENYTVTRTETNTVTDGGTTTTNAGGAAAGGAAAGGAAAGGAAAGGAAAGGAAAGGAAAGGAAAGGAAAGGAAGGVAAGGAAAGGAGAEGGTAVANAGNQGPQEIVDLDEQQTPLAEYEGGEAGQGENPELEGEGNVRAQGMSTGAKVAVGALIVAILAGAGWFLFKRFADDDDDGDEK